jgi:hypothetical protein
MIDDYTALKSRPCAGQKAGRGQRAGSRNIPEIFFEAVLVAKPVHVCCTLFVL